MKFSLFIYSILFAIIIKCSSLPGDQNGRIDRRTFQQIHPSQNSPAQRPQADAPVKGPGSSPGGGNIQSILGQGVKADNYDPDIYDFRGGGPVQFIDELSTDFGSANCWNNVKTNNIKWQKATGAPDSKKVQYLFGTSTGPGDDYLVAFTNNQRKPTEAAKFESCSMPCISGDLKISLKYWVSSGVNMQVCTREVFFDDEEPTNCQKLPIQQQPGPASLIFKNVKELSAIVIIASNFVDEKGGIAIVDDIAVSYTPCSETSTLPSNAIVTQQPSVTPPPVPSGEGDSATTCQNSVCSFQHNFCNYKDFQELGKPGAKKFSLETGRYHNRLTGIHSGPANVKKYAAAYLLRKDQAGLESSPLDLTDDRILQFYSYTATQNIFIKVCFDNELKCPFATGGDVQRDSRKWKLSSVPVPKQTKKIFIVALNEGLNEGAVGVTDVKLLIPDIPGGNSGSANACPNTVESVLRDTEQSSGAVKQLPQRRVVIHRPNFRKLL